MNEDIEQILSDIEDLLNQRWMNKSWTAHEILQMTNGFELLRQDLLDVTEKDEDDDDDNVEEYIPEGD